MSTAQLSLPRRRWIAWLATGVGLLVAAGMLAFAVPLPFVDGYLEDVVTKRVSAQVACPGSLPKPPTVAIRGGRLVPQVLRQNLSEIRLAVPDATLSGVPHAAFAATLRDVSQPSATTTHAGSMDATITVGFAHLPSEKGEPARSYRRAPDGGLAVSVLVPAEDSDNVKAKLFLKMQLRGETVRSVPQRLQIFGRVLPAGQVSDLAGGVRVEQLPHLPDGVSYHSISPERDGVHVTLAGVSTTALDTLPPQVGGRDVTYSAEDGLLGISTSFGIKPIVDVPLTIFAAPRLTGTTLTLQPRLVRILGADRKLGDPLAKLVLTQIKQQDLVRALPALPTGVTYRSVTVDGGGLRLVIAGTTVQPFSALRPPDDRPTVFGAENGLLTATAKGSQKDTPIVLHGRPQIDGSTLNITPQEIEMFGTRFPAEDVLSEVRTRQTSYALQPLPAHLAYQGVRVLPNALEIRLTGRDVTLTKGLLTGSTC
jgi:hypothetical protein